MEGEGSVFPVHNTDNHQTSNAFSFLVNYLFILRNLFLCVSRSSVKIKEILTKFRKIRYVQVLFLIPFEEYLGFSLPWVSFKRPQNLGFLISYFRTTLRISYPPLRHIFPSWISDTKGNSFSDSFTRTVHKMSEYEWATTNDASIKKIKGLKELLF